MRTIKQRLTIIKNRIDENFPDTDDLYDFPGISKKLIIQIIEQSYALLAILEGYENRFEVIVLKRNLSNNFDIITSLFSENIENPDVFNRFLNILSAIKSSIKLTYISVTENPFRIESELQQATEDLSNVREKTSSLDQIFEILTKANKEFDQFIEDKNSAMDTLKDSNSKSEEILNDLGTKISAIQKNYNSVQTWTDSISILHSTATTVQTEINELKGDIAKNSSELTKNIKETKSLQEKLKDLFNKDEQFQNQISKTISDANQFGMAGSFYKRKQELIWPTFLWGAASILSILLFTAISTLIVAPEFSSVLKISIFPESATQNIWYRLAIIGPLVWLSWFTSKQFGYITRIKEDYSYKYAISMAFEKYKKEAHEVNEDILKELIQLVIVNIASNPTNLYNSKSNHASPLNEFIETLTRKLKIDVKANVKSP